MVFFLEPRRLVLAEVARFDLVVVFLRFVAFFFAMIRLLRAPGNADDAHSSRTTCVGGVILWRKLMVDSTMPKMAMFPIRDSSRT